MRRKYEEVKYFENLLLSINHASALLMDVNSDTFEQRLLEAMDIVAKAVNVDRIYLWKNFLIDGKLHGTQLYEWTYKVEPAQGTDLTVKVLYEDAFPDLEEPLSKGGNVNSLVRDMTPKIREYLEELGILSILVEPIFIEGKFWGFVGFDDCHNERIFTDIEERMLKSIALLFGRAYHHNEERNLTDSLNQVSMLLLDTNPDTFEQRLIEAMGIVGQAVKIDCVYLWKNYTLDEKLYCSQVFEWSPKKTMFASGELYSYDDVVPGWDKTLSGGNCINSLVRNLTPLEQDHLSPSGILSILVIPIFIDDLFWGFVGFDDCSIERTFTNTEVEKLRSMVLLFGNAHLHNKANRLIREQN
jgi:GAF domain-containing protein